MHPSHGHNMTIVNGISRIGYMAGGKKARWVDEDMADVITQKATAFIRKNKAGPFFLYFSTHDIHVPRVPNPRFVGKTEMGNAPKPQLYNVQDDPGETRDLALQHPEKAKELTAKLEAIRQRGRNRP